MCGRYRLTAWQQRLVEHFDADPPEHYEASYNIAPSQAVPIIRRSGTRRCFAAARWGLVPGWSRDRTFGGYSTINARAETVATKPAFRAAFRHRRCLIPADGYYEWQVLAGSKRKQPWCIALRDDEPFAFAGLWERWEGADGEGLESCCIIVTVANETTRPIHDRMPVILDRADWDVWLDPATQPAERLQTLLRPYDDGPMLVWPVDTWVNNPRNTGPRCSAPLDAEAMDRPSSMPPAS